MKITRSSIKSEKDESSKSLGLETQNLIIPSLLASLEVPKNWFENQIAFGRWIDIFKHHPLSSVDILD